MSFPFHERSALWGGQMPVNNNGSPRPLLAQHRPYLTVHYTGASVNYGDFGDSPQEIRAIQAWAASAAKRTPWEYNYVIDTESNVWEYAGLYQAAHSSGENSLSYGVLLLLGINDDVTLGQLGAFRWWRWVLGAFGHLAPNHEVRGHGDMPGASTGCPGDRVRAQWNNLLMPWEETPPEQPPPGGPISLDPHCQFMLMPGDSPWTVASIAYGDGNRYSELVAANPGSWGVGRRVVVPNEAGARYTVQPGDSPWSILATIWPNDSPNIRLNTFVRWNGGSGHVLSPGELVWAPVEPGHGI